MYSVVQGAALADQVAMEMMALHHAVKRSRGVGGRRVRAMKPSVPSIII